MGARADSAVPGPSAGPPPLWAVISLLEVGWDWNPSAQAEAIISPAEEEERPLQQCGPGSRCTSRQRKGRSRHGHVLTAPRCCLWPEQRGTAKPSLSFPNHNGKAAAKMTPQISASISAASIRELLFLDTLWTAGTPAPCQPQLGQPTCLGVHETASAIPLLPWPSGRGSVTELKSRRGIILGLKLFPFIYSSRRTRITQSLRARVTRHSSGHKALCLAGPSWQESQGQSLYSRFTASSVFPWQQATEVTRYGCVSSSCTGLGTPVSSSFLPRRPLAPFPHVHTSPSAEGCKRLAAHLPWPQQSQRPARACCSPEHGGFSLTCSDGHSEGIPTSHHGDLHGLQPHNQVGHAAVAAGVGAQLPVLVAPKGVTVARG